MVFLGFVIVLFMVKDGNSCISNPFLYGAEKAQTVDSGELSCQCSFPYNPNYSPFRFDKDNITILRP